MNSEDKRVVVKQYIESRYTRVNKLKAEREARKQTLQARHPPAGSQPGASPPRSLSQAAACAHAAAPAPPSARTATLLPLRRPR